MPIFQSSGLSPCYDLLIVKLSSLGDVVHALGAVSIVKRKLDVKVAWLVNEAYLPLFEGVSFVDELVTPRDARRLFRRFELAIDLQGLVRSALWSFFLAKHRWGFSLSALREPLAGLLYTERFSPIKAHVVEMQRELICACLGIEDDGIYDFGIRVFEHEREKVKRFLPEEFVLVVPSAGWRTKELSVEWCLDFLGQWLRITDVPVLFMPGMGDKRRLFCLGEWLLPELSLRDAMAVISLSRAVVAPDTGFLHIADALGVPCLGLYCASLGERNGPFLSKSFVTCNCPSYGCWRKKCPSLCTSSIPVEEVVNFLLGLLEGSSGVYRSKEAVQAHRERG